MNKSILTTIVFAALGGAAAAWAWDKYGKKKCNCNKTASASKPVTTSTGANLSVDVPAANVPVGMSPANSTMAFDGWGRNTW